MLYKYVKCYDMKLNSKVVLLMATLSFKTYTYLCIHNDMKYVAQRPIHTAILHAFAYKFYANISIKTEY